MGTRQEKRYEFRNRPKVTVISAPEDATEEAVAELLDISRGGAKLALTDGAQIGGIVTVRFHELEMDLPAHVCWCRRESEQRWWAACLFQPQLPADVLEKLLDGGYLERRHHQREAVDLRALAKWQLGEAYTVGIRDFSTGGVCFSSPRRAQRNQRLLLEVEQPDATKANVLVQVQWQIKFDEDYLIGCSFVNRQGVAAIRRAVDAQHVEAVQASRQRGQVRGSFGRLVALFKGPASPHAKDNTPVA